MTLAYLADIAGNSFDAAATAVVLWFGPRLLSSWRSQRTADERFAQRVAEVHRAVVGESALIPHLGGADGD